MVAQSLPFEALADATRRTILDLLCDDSANAGEIARHFPRLSRPAVSRHLAVLRRSRLVVAHRKGRELRYSLNAQPLHEVDIWLRKYEVFWDRQLQAFKSHMGATARKETQDADES